MAFEQNLNLSYAQKLQEIKTVLDKSQEFEGEFYSVTKAGIDVDVFKNVFSPNYFDDSEYFANNIPNVEGMKVLEVGTGTGLIALKFASGKAEKVIATDINPDAVKNAKHNAKKHKMDATIEIRQGSIFQPVRNEKFDLIFWNIPFCYLDVELKNEIGLHKKLTQLEKSVFNSNYNYFYTYLQEGFEYLNDGGKLLVGFSPTLGKEDDLEDLCTNLNLDKIVLNEDQIAIEGNLEVLQILEFRRND